MADPISFRQQKYTRAKSIKDIKIKNEQFSKKMKMMSWVYHSYLYSKQLKKVMKAQIR